MGIIGGYRYDGTNIVRFYGPGSVAPPSDAGNTARQMLMGAHTQPVTNAGFQSLESSIGSQMLLHRIFNSGFPATWGNTLGTIDDGTARTTWLSLKYNTTDWASVGSGGHDAAITAFAQSIPVGRSVWLTLNHEPENDGGSAANWRAEQQRFYSLVKSVRPDVLVGQILMGWTFNPSSGRNPQDWNVGAGSSDFYGIDEYNSYHFPQVGSPNTWDNEPSITMTNFTAFCADIGVPGAVGEYASAEDQTGIGPSRKANTIAAIIDYCYHNGYLGFSYFNDYKPGDTAEDMLLTSNAASLITYNTAIATYQDVS